MKLLSLALVACVAVTGYTYAQTAAQAPASGGFNSGFLVPFDWLDPPWHWGSWGTGKRIIRAARVRRTLLFGRFGYRAFAQRT